MGFNDDRSTRGDTIVEVLIAIAVVGSVLAITFSIMNHNILILRDNQERTEASKIAQSQLERLKDAWDRADAADAPGSNGHPFCMNSGVVSGFSGSSPTAVASEDNLVNYPVGCIESFYHTAIKYSASEKSYLVSVRWDSITGVRGEVVMGYRLQ